MNIEYFFDGLESEGSSGPTRQQNFLELAHSFIAVPDRKHREAICDLARAMVNPMLKTDAS